MYSNIQIQSFWYKETFEDEQKVYLEFWFLHQIFWVAITNEYLECSVCYNAKETKDE